MRFTKFDTAIDQLCRSRHNKNCITILLELWTLMSVFRILNSQAMQAELLLNPVQKFAVRL